MKAIHGVVKFELCVTRTCGFIVTGKRRMFAYFPTQILAKISVERLSA
jgi:hypothetical protein